MMYKPLFQRIMFHIDAPLSLIHSKLKSLPTEGVNCLGGSVEMISSSVSDIESYLAGIKVMGSFHVHMHMCTSRDVFTSILDLTNLIKLGISAERVE